MIRFFNLLVVLSLSKIAFSQEVNFTLSVKKCTVDTLFIFGDQQEEFLLFRNNKFSKKINIKPGFYSLNLGDNFVDIYLVKNAKLDGNVEFDNFNSTLNFKGFGSNEANFLIRLQKISESVDNIDSFKLIHNKNELDLSLAKYRNKLISILPKSNDKDFLVFANERIENQVKYFEEVGIQNLSLFELNGLKCPDFNFIDIKGTTFKLNNFENKYLLIDIWATWCAPCIDDLKYLEEIKQNFKEKPIEFISVSIDDKIENWKKNINERNLIGFQLLSPKARDDVFFEQIKLITVPRYLLISPEGIIVNSNTPRPSSPELVKLLDSVVK
ncbi:TlpA family protein disulfide reductase [Flavobacterium sp.]|uniref:TlpA family protein disulfide reductase n=1 Tax=Flavobacterium sp. TaxID=239 RepID=UPI0035B216F9